MRSNRPAATGNAYEDVLKALGSLDDLVVAGPQFLAGEFHEFCRYNASADGSESAKMCEIESEMKRTRPRSCQPTSANAI
jgi:hypothetical protein